MSIENPWPEYDFPLEGSELRPSEVNPETVIVGYGTQNAIEPLMERWSSAMSKGGWQEVSRLEGETNTPVMHLMFRREGSLAQLTFEKVPSGVDVAVSL
ncbi:MAG: hypothetical protein AAGA48_23015 [Myxococcota bacterium]